MNVKSPRLSLGADFCFRARESKEMFGKPLVTVAASADSRKRTKETVRTTMQNKTETTYPKFVRARVIADMLDCNERSVQLWAARGEIPSVKVGKSLRFDLDAVLVAIQRKGARK